jgi:hypothetical protein
MRHHGLSVAIIGVGPRGLSVLERLLIRLREHSPARDVVIWAIDTTEHGSGRIWRTTQDSCLLTNATAGELTILSPDSPLYPVEDGTNSFADWSVAHLPGRPIGSGEYPARRDYGRYLHETFERLCGTAPPGVDVRPVLGQATDLRRVAGGLVVTLDQGRLRLRADKVVLATGHSGLRLHAEQQTLATHARRHPGLRYVEPSIAADMPLDRLPADGVVGVRGLGLTFYDVVACLTVGRGGRFTRQGAGGLRYLASGREPRLVAGSRSGMPFLARPELTEPPQLAPRPVVLTEMLITRLRERAIRLRGTPQLDFAREIEPIIQTELEHAYYTCAVRARDGRRAAETFGSDFRAAVGDWGTVSPARRDQLVTAHGLADLPDLRPDELARPFRTSTFASPSAFNRRLVTLLRQDVAAARAGTAGSPVKAAMEVLRSLRPALPAIVDFGGLLPESQRDFLGRFTSMSFRLSAGPPVGQVERLIALMEAGIVHVCGPETRITTDDRAGRFVLGSPQVRGSWQATHTVVEASAPGIDLMRDTNPLLCRLLSRGMISEHTVTDPTTGHPHRTGGLAVTPAPFHVVDAAGQADPDIYAIGVATQNTRWFTQVGTGRPGQDSPLCRDADAIARDVLGRAPAERTWDLAG